MSFDRNPNGTNQWGHKCYPPDGDLCVAFAQYSKENNGSGLTYQEQIERLHVQFGLIIKRTSLIKLRKRLGIMTVRSTKASTTRQDRSQILLDLKQDDPLGQWGVNQTRQRLANAGLLMTRDEVRSVLHDHFDEEFSHRFIALRQPMQRTPLNCLGPGHQMHCDGHEKLSAAALQMGDVSLSIYAFKDQYSSNCLNMRVLPNVRKSLIIAHLFLDMVEASGYISIQMITDKGSEIGDMIHCHRELRLDAAPEFTLDKWPSTFQVQSKHNTPIEGFWRWLRAGEGLNLRDVIVKGRDTGTFNPNDSLHVDVFNWLFPPLVQHRLDLFCDYWNNHRISKQKKKLLPSGASPMQMLTAPRSVRADANECWIKVRSEKIAALREELGGTSTRNSVFQWIDPHFEVLADDVYRALGSPLITLGSAWNIFGVMVDSLEEFRAVLYVD